MTRSDSKKQGDHMEIVTAIAVVFLASISIFKLSTIASKIDIRINDNDYLNSHAKYQLLLLLLAVTVLLFLYLQSADNLTLFLSSGNISAPVEPVKWFGIGDGKTWIFAGLYLCALLTPGTFGFVYFQFRKQGIKVQELFPYTGWILLFALSNSFSEEIIYRLGIIVPLYNVIGANEIVLLSAIVFGLVHFGGMPHGLIGMLMAGFLGWFLAKSVIETQGIFWAWFIHFLQDVVIYIGFIGHNIATDRVKLGQ